MGVKFNVSQGKPYKTASGEVKKKWINVGVVFENSQGNLSMKLEVLPIPDAEGNIWLSFFEPRQNDGAPRGRQDSADAPVDGDATVPF